MEREQENNAVRVNEQKRARDAIATYVVADHEDVRFVPRERSVEKVAKKKRRTLTAEIDGSLNGPKWYNPVLSFGKEKIALEQRTAKHLATYAMYEQKRVDSYFENSAPKDKVIHPASVADAAGNESERQVEVPRVYEIEVGEDGVIDMRLDHTGEKEPAMSEREFVWVAETPEPPVESSPEPHAPVQPEPEPPAQPAPAQPEPEPPAQPAPVSSCTSVPVPVTVPVPAPMPVQIPRPSAEFSPLDCVILSSASKPRRGTMCPDRVVIVSRGPVSISTYPAANSNDIVGDLPLSDPPASGTVTDKALGRELLVEVQSGVFRSLFEDLVIRELVVPGHLLWVHTHDQYKFARITYGPVEGEMRWFLKPVLTVDAPRDKLPACKKPIDDVAYFSLNKFMQGNSLESKSANTGCIDRRFKMLKFRYCMLELTPELALKLALSPDAGHMVAQYANIYNMYKGPERNHVRHFRGTPEMMDAFVEDMGMYPTSPVQPLLQMPIQPSLNDLILDEMPVAPAPVPRTPSSRRSRSPVPSKAAASSSGNELVLYTGLLDGPSFSEEQTEYIENRLALTKLNPTQLQQVVEMQHAMTFSTKQQQELNMFMSQHQQHLTEIVNKTTSIALAASTLNETQQTQALEIAKQTALALHHERGLNEAEQKQVADIALRTIQNAPASTVVMENMMTVLQEVQKLREEIAEVRQFVLAEAARPQGKEVQWDPVLEDIFASKSFGVPNTPMIPGMGSH